MGERRLGPPSAQRTVRRAISSAPSSLGCSGETTNLNTGGTYTNVFIANSKDQTIVNNGDGTITMTVFASGGSRVAFTGK